MKEKIKYRNHVITIERDDDGGDRDLDHPNSYGNGEWQKGPKHECDDPAHCWQWISIWLGGRYSSDLNAGFETPDDFLEYFNEDEWLVLTVRGYSHSGWAFKLSSEQPGWQWDSGFAGLVAIRKELSPALLERGDARYHADRTVKHFEAWFNGEYYGYSVEGPVSDDSCWGYLAIDDDLSYMISDAKSNIDASINYARKKAFAQLKTWIKNRVPLHIRQKEYEYVSH